MSFENETFELTEYQKSGIISMETLNELLDCYRRIGNMENILITNNGKNMKKKEGKIPKEKSINKDNIDKNDNSKNIEKDNGEIIR